MKPILAGLFALSLILGLCVSAGAASGQRLPEGSGQPVFHLADGHPDITVYSYVPPEAGPDSPVVFVLTGLKRNAAEYRNAWIDAARRYGFIVLVPKFAEPDYPGVAGYNLGQITAADGQDPRPRSDWSFTVIDAVFERLVQRGETRRPGYDLFGHSAGCQFVHRMLTFVPTARVHAAICSAAGWWTLPDTDNEWPYGLKNAPVAVGRPDLARLFAQPLLVLSGAADIDPYHRYLRRSYQAMAQGSNRVERAWNYYKTAQQKADRYHDVFHWAFQLVPGAGHDYEKIAPYAAARFAAFERNGGFDVTTPQALPARVHTGLSSR